MRKQKINLIDGTFLPRVVIEPQKSKKTKKGRWVFRLLIFFLALIILFSTNVIFSQNSLITNLGRLSFWEGVTRLMIGKDKILKGELFDRINVLILGMGGALHEGPYLTDTIILASIKPSTGQIGLLSIPRDLYVPVPGYGWRKINLANALGMAESKDGGLLTSQVVSDVFDIPIHYWARIDFNLFKDLIDELGGIEIEVEKSFADYQFPGPNFSYRTVSFEKGWQTMDGEKALQFARSRHGNNGEDSDFARSQRQQKILFAIKEKIIEENILSQPRKIWNVYNSLKDNLSTNLDLSQAIRLAKISSEINQKNIITKVIEAEPNGPLKSEITLQGAFILKPKTGNFKELAQIAKDFFSVESGPSSEAVVFGQKVSAPAEEEIEPLVGAEKSRVVILNGTYVSGLAQQASETLSAKGGSGFEVIQTGNTPVRDYKKNIVYQINPGASASGGEERLKELCQIFSAETGQELQGELKNLFDKQTDFLIILGENS